MINNNTNEKKNKEILREGNNKQNTPKIPY